MWENQSSENGELPCESIKISKRQTNTYGSRSSFMYECNRAIYCPVWRYTPASFCSLHLLPSSETTISYMDFDSRRCIYPWIRRYQLKRTLSEFTKRWRKNYNENGIPRRTKNIEKHHTPKTVVAFPRLSPPTSIFNTNNHPPTFFEEQYLVIQKAFTISLFTLAKYNTPLQSLRIRRFSHPT